MAEHRVVTREQWTAERRALLALMSPLMSWTMRRANRKDLARLKRLLES